MTFANHATFQQRPTQPEVTLPATTVAQQLAQDARQGLRMVAEGEDKVIDGWLLYGVSLLKGRLLFPKNGQGNKAFSDWISQSQLASVAPDNQAAALWAAHDPAWFTNFRRLHPKVRTVRGLHAKWKDAQKPQPKAPKEVPTEDELRVVQKLRELVGHPSTDAGVRANAQRKLDTYNERFGEIEPETAKQKLTKQELSVQITKMATLKAVSDPLVFEIIQYAILNTYGAADGRLERVLAEVLKRSKRKDRGYETTSPRPPT